MSPDINWLVLSPALTILVTAALALLYSLSDGDTRGGAAIALVGAAFAGVLNYALYMTDGTLSSFGGRFLADSTAVLLNFVILAGLVIAILASWNYVRRADLEQPEYYPLMLLASVGAMVMSASGDLITLVLGLEIMSLAVYVLSAWRDGNSRAARHSQEAGMKYFLLGATGSAVFIYGIALTYGATGEFSWQALTAAAQAPDFSQPLLHALGVLMLLAGLGFKAAVFPFHQWAADAYTGAPMPVTAFMSVVVKTAAFAALLRLAAEFLPLASPAAFEAFVWLVGATMVIGNFSALAQNGVKRMLAWSSVAHAGYLGLAVLAAGQTGTGAAMYYLLAYTFMTAGAFAVLGMVSGPDDSGDSLQHLAGLGRRRPGLALGLALFMLSLAGIPPLAGFAGKFLVFSAAIDAGHVVLAVIGIATSIVALFYYFRVVRVIYFEPSSEMPLPEGRDRAGSTAVALAAAGILVLGAFPFLFQ